MAKILKKKIKFKIVPIFLFLLVCAILYFLGSIVYETDIYNIYILNNELLTDQEVIELAGIDDYSGFYKKSSKSISVNIYKS